MMRICWATHQKVEAAGAAYGYTSASTNLLQAISRDPRVEVTDRSPDIVLHFCHPRNFLPNLYTGAKNVLFSMYEMDPLPSEFRHAARVADAVVVPSNFCLRLFRQHLDHGTRLFLSPLGYDPSVWKYVPRSPPTTGEPFRFLFAGDLNDRKGYHLLMEAWGEVFAGIPDVELYMKLSGDGPVEERKVISRGNVTCDFRSLPRAELYKIFLSSHAFVFPSMGEGWGLTALEAAASGLPIISTRCGGVEDFLDERSTWFLPSHETPVRVSHAHGGGFAFGKRANPVDIALAMRDVIASYGAALKMARAQQVAVSKFTWADAADHLIGVLGEV